MSARILVTGAAGFVGSFVAARLAAQGNVVAGADNFDPYYSPRLKHDRVAALLHPAGVECHRIDLADEAQVRTVFDKVAPEYVIHLAAQAGVRYSLVNPKAYIQSNLVAFGHVLEACRHGQVTHLLYASSSSVYGENARVPFHEDDPTDSPVSLYAATKKANEVLACSYSNLYGMPATGLRFFTVYGPWGRPDMACFSFADRMLRGEAIPVFAEGMLRRDFTYIDDIVEGVVRLLYKPVPPASTGGRHAIFNIGNNEPVTVLSFIRALETAFGKRAQLEFLPMQPGDVQVTYAAIDKLRDWVGFAPATSLSTGLDRFREWFMAYQRER